MVVQRVRNLKGHHHIPTVTFDNGNAALTSGEQGRNLNNSDHRKVHRETLAREKFARSMVCRDQRVLEIESKVTEEKTKDKKVPLSASQMRLYFENHQSQNHRGFVRVNHREAVGSDRGYPDTQVRLRCRPVF